LGTSTSKEAKEYFSDIGNHKKDFVWVDDQDGNEIELAFSKKRIADRKQWLTNFQVSYCFFCQFGMVCICWINVNVPTIFQPGTYLDHKEKKIKYRDFINKELILFSMADLQRSIPSMVDGFKPGQRKILFCAFKRNLVKETKVRHFGIRTFKRMSESFSYTMDYQEILFNFFAVFLLNTGCSVLWLCVRTLSIPPWRAEFSKHNCWNGSEFCWQQ